MSIARSIVVVHDRLREIDSCAMSDATRVDAH